MIKKQFTYNYSQPDEYHFSLDSVEMPLSVAQIHENQDLSQYRVLDLCSGCGVVGFEFHFYQPKIAEMHFVEVQKESYLRHFHRNLEMIKPHATDFRVHWLNYDQLQGKDFAGKFDLVLANPPYFEADQGKMSPFEFKNRCRFYLDSDFSNLIAAILNILKAKASSYILLRPLTEHKKDLKTKLEELLRGRATFQQVAMIRGTELIQIQKLSDAFIS